MKQRTFLIWRGWAYAIVTVASAIFIFGFNKLDTFGTVFAFAFLAFTAYNSYSCFRQLKHTREEDRAYVLPTDTPVSDQIIYYRRMLWTGAIAFIVLSVWILIDLNDLESGNVIHVSIWAPIAMLYNLGGYWVGILTTPILGIFTIISLYRKIRELENVGN